MFDLIRYVLMINLYLYYCSTNCMCYKDMIKSVIRVSKKIVSN